MQSYSVCFSMELYIFNGNEFIRVPLAMVFGKEEKAIEPEFILNAVMDELVVALNSYSKER